MPATVRVVAFGFLVVAHVVYWRRWADDVQECLCFRRALMLFVIKPERGRRLDRDFQLGEERVSGTRGLGPMLCAVIVGLSFGQADGATGERRRDDPRLWP